MRLKGTRCAAAVVAAPRVERSATQPASAITAELDEMVEEEVLS